MSQVATSAVPEPVDPRVGAGEPVPPSVVPAVATPAGVSPPDALAPLEGPEGTAEAPCPDGPEAVPAGADGETAGRPRLCAMPVGYRRERKAREETAEVGVVGSLTPAQRLLLLDTWQRSQLPAGDFAELVGMSKHTLYAWKKRFDEAGPEGLLDRPRGGPRGSRLAEVTRRAIVMLKQANPDYGCERISALLVRGPGLAASPGAVGRVLLEAGYEPVAEPTHPHGEEPKRFERAKPNQLWQTDLFTFLLKRENRRVYLVGFLDDHSRYVVSYGVHASASTALVIEALRAGIAAYGPPEEVLTDNGPQYVTWRGKSQMRRELEKLGIRHVVSKPKHPQTLGKVERFWGTLWKECVEGAVFHDVEDARRRVGLFIDYYNFQRPHSALEGLAPADRFFGAAPEVKQTLAARVAANARELARHGVPKAPFYLTGNAGGKAVSVHAEGDRLILTREDGTRQEVAWGSPEAQTLALSRAERLGADGLQKQATPALPQPVAPSAEMPGSAAAQEAADGGADAPVGEAAGDAEAAHE